MLLILVQDVMVHSGEREDRLITE